MVFDVLRLDGRDLTARRWNERREMLADLDLERLGLAGAGRPTTTAPMLLEATLAAGTRGHRQQAARLAYRSGKRSPDWLKFAHRHRRSYVVGGWRPQEGTTDRLAALLVGELTAEGLLYRGRVGSGIGGTAGRSLRRWWRRWAATPARSPTRCRGGTRAGTFWVEPELVVDVDTHGLGYERLRQPSFQGVRADLTPEDLADRRDGQREPREKHEKPRSSSTSRAAPEDPQPRQGALPAHRHDQGRGAELLRADRAGAAAAPADRAVTRIRWPHGMRGHELLREERPAGTPSWVRTVKVPTTGSRTADKQDGTLVFPVVDDLATLTWLVNLAALELHVHQWTVGRNGRPRNADRLVIDLDPGEPAGLHECCQVALLVRDALAERGLTAKPVTSGSKGLHLYADLPRRLPPDDSTALAKEVAEALQAEHAHLVTATMTKAQRPGKVFLDWSQNSGSKTTISPYSLRGRERPWVATPVTWDEVEQGAEDPFGLEQFRFDEVLDRVEEHGDLFG